MPNPPASRATPKPAPPRPTIRTDSPPSARLSGLRDELDEIITDDDDRWYAFNFDKPSDPSTPEAPANLVATRGAAVTKTVIAHWDDARLADNYRLRAVNKANGRKIAN